MVVTKRMKNMALSFTGDVAYVLRDSWVDAYSAARPRGG